MKRLLAALAALAGAFRTVCEYCTKTGKWVARTVLSPFAGSGPSPMVDDEPPVPTAAAQEADALSGIRRLAGAMAADRVQPDDIADVADYRIEWLAAMDRGMLAKVLCADDAALRAHIRGERSIRGLLAADTASVAEYRRARAMVIEDDYEMAPAMAYAA